MRRERAKALALASLVGLAGCEDALAELSCDRYRQGCHTGEWEPEPGCAENGVLDVALGLGDGAYEPLAPGETIPVNRDVPRWPHVVLGVEVAGFDAERHDELLLTLSAQVEEDCGEPSCDSHEVAGRHLVLGQYVPLWVQDGLVREFGIAVAAQDWPTADAVRVFAFVEDPCGNTGIGVHTSGP